MMDKDILIGAGFQSHEDGRCTKQLGELVVMLESDETGIVISVPCAPAATDFENDIDESIKNSFEGFSNVDASYSGRVITITSAHIGSDGLAEILLLIERAKEKFDLLPVCMCCKRVITVKAVSIDGCTEVLCGICQDEKNLARKHKEQTEHFRTLEKERIKKQRPAFSSLKYMIKPCLKIGLVTSAIGFVLMWLGFIFIPAFRLMAFIPGFVMGMMTMAIIRKENILHLAVRYIAVTVLSVTIITIITSITAYLSYRAVNGISTAGVADSNIPLFGSVAVFNLFFGMAAMLLGQAIMYFVGE